MRQGLLGQDRSTDLLSSSALLCRRMVEPTSLSLTAQLAENSRKIVGKLLCLLPWLHRKVTVTSSLASVQPAGVAEGCMTATPSHPQACWQPLDGRCNATKILLFHLLSEARGNDTERSKNVLRDDYYSCKKI